MAIDDSDNSNFDAIIDSPFSENPSAVPSLLALPIALTVHQPIPALRDVRVRLVKTGDEGDSGGENEKNSVLLEDPDGFATQTAVLSTWAYMLALFFDGRRTATQAAIAFSEKYNHSVEPEQALSLQNELDEALFLNSRNFEEKLAKQLDGYLHMPTWPASHAGTAYPSDPVEFSAKVEGFFRAEDGPGELNVIPCQSRDLLRAAIVPHIDLNAGGGTYAHAYKYLMEDSQADLIIILGVSHQYTGNQLYSVSQKDFETPLGTLKTNRGIAKRLHEASKTDNMAAEMAHRGEHSIEFQAALIQTLLVTRCKRCVEIVPILCGSVDRFLGDDGDPFNDSEFSRFSDALRYELEHCGRKWCVLCSVDLSHVGPEFDHSSMIDARTLVPLARMDLKMLKFVEKLDAGGFYKEIARTQNSRHVDAVLSVLTMLHACRSMIKPGRLLHYDQMLKDLSHSAVSYAAMVFEEAVKIQ